MISKENNLHAQTVGLPFIKVAVDGPAASGKSSASSGLAKRMGLRFIPSGWFYRAVAGYALQKGWSLEAAPSDAVKNGLTGLSVELLPSSDGLQLVAEGEPPTTLKQAQLESDQIGEAASQFSKHKAVRQWVNEYLHKVVEQEQASGGNGIVMEGRDIGTVVMPEALLKFFVTASVAIRAQRRSAQESIELQANPKYAQHALESTKAKKDDSTLKETEQSLAMRDQRDQNRQEAPLTAAADAIVIDTTTMNLEEVIHLMETHCSPAQSPKPTE